MTATLASVFQPNPSQRAVRLVTGTVVAVAVTSGLFWMMQYMLEMGDAELKDEPFRPMLEFVRLQRDEEISRPDDIVRPPPPEPPPQRPQQLDMDDSSKSVPVTDFGLPVSPDVRPDITGDYASDGDYLPFVKVTPIYPQRALARGLEGSCVVQFTVTRSGGIRDPFVVEDQCTSSVFHRASIEAVLKFKYRPRVIDGVAVEVPGVQNRFVYQITE